MEGPLSLEMVHRLVNFLRALCAGLSERWGREAIRDADALADFVASRAAHVGQSALYGYLKTRMGTQHRELFQDPAFAEALSAARDRVVVACISDLTVFAVATLPDTDREARASELFEAAARTVFGTTPDHRFAERLRSLDWEREADAEHAFRTSMAELIAAAPVTQQFRELDREIVENSIRFRWVEVRRQLRARLDPMAFRET